MKTKQAKTNITPVARIEEIKERISCDNKNSCKVEVYQSWENIFKEEE